jgi:glycosyltransferase involved in cell wall biosynthesis
MKIAVCGIAPKSGHFRTYVNFLAGRGHDVTVITDADEFDAPVRVVNFARPAHLARFVPPRMGWVVRVWRLWRSLHGHGFDVVNIQQMSPSGVIAALLWRGPLVPTFWGSDILRLSERPWWVRYLMRRAVRRATVLHATSEVIADRLKDMGADPERIATFNYGVDLQLFRLRDAEPEPGSILSTRSLRPLYRPAAIVRALPAVIAREPLTRLTLANRGRPEDVEMLEALIAELRLTDRVEFTGYLDKAELARRLAGAEVWVSIPTSDSLAISLQDAMACGAFPVVADLPAMREALEEPCAVFVTDVAPEPLADALCRAQELSRTGAHVLANRAGVEQFGDRSRNLPRFERALVAAASCGPGGSSSR